MMRLIIILKIFILPLLSTGQSFEFSYQFYDSGQGGKVFVTSDANCNEKLNHCDFNKRIRNIAHHPGGYIVGMEYLRTYDVGLRFWVDSFSYFKLDFINCKADYLFSVKGDKNSLFGIFFYIDYLGRYYLFDHVQSLMYRTDINDYIFKPIKSLPKGAQIGDMMIIRDNIFLVDFSYNNFYKCDTNFNIIQHQFFQGLSIASIGSLPISCDSSLFIIGTYNSTVEEHAKNLFRPGMRFCSYDFENNKIIDSLCFVNTFDTGSYPAGLTSFTEFFSADAECDLLIDLDRDNSKGLYPYDYKSNITLCTSENELFICDDDLYIHTSAPLDSIVICIVGIKNYFEEGIFSTLLPQGFSFSKNSDSCWTISKLNASDNDYTQAIKSLRYKNFASNRKSGTRIIQLQGYNSIKKGKVVNAFLEVGQTVNAGRDTSIIICGSSDSIMLKSVLSASAVFNGIWTPALNTDFFIPNQNIFGEYIYIVSDLICGQDTAKIVFIDGKIDPFQLGPNRSICKEEYIEYFIRPKDTSDIYSEIRWNGIISGEYHRLDKPGEYILSIKSKFGCWFNDTILISQSNQFISKDSTIYLCENKTFSYKNIQFIAGSTIRDTIKAKIGCDTIVKIYLDPDINIQTEKDTLICFGDNLIYKNQVYNVGQTIFDTLIGKNECDTLVNIRINAFPTSIPIINGDTVVCIGQKVQLKSSSQKSYIWNTGDTSNAIFVKAGTYSLTITDLNSCTSTKFIEVHEAPLIEYQIESYDPLCRGDYGNVILKTFGGGIPPIRYLLNGEEDNDGFFDNLEPGIYYAKFIDSLGCERSDTIIIYPANNFDVTLVNKLDIEEGSSILINYYVHHGQIDRIRIEPDKNISLEEKGLRILGVEDQDYCISFLDSNNCEVKRNIKIRVKRYEEFYAPNVFSPNNDGVNDKFVVFIGASLQFQFLNIYNRWGEIVFSTRSKQNDWDGESNGKMCLPGVYFYIVYVKTKDGKIVKFSGDLTLVR